MADYNKAKKIVIEKLKDVRYSLGLIFGIIGLIFVGPMIMSNIEGIWAVSIEATVHEIKNSPTDEEIYIEYKYKNNQYRNVPLGWGRAENFKIGDKVNIRIIPYKPDRVHQRDSILIIAFVLLCFWGMYKIAVSHVKGIMDFLEVFISSLTRKH